LVELPTDAEIIRAMEAEALEAACVTLDAALRLQAGGGDLRVIAVADTSVGGDAVVAVREGLDSVADLRGKRVAAESHGVGIVFLARALRAAGLGLDEVVFINADIPEHGRLIAGGLVDAVVTYSPEKERLVGAGGVVLCDSARLPGEVIDVLVVRADAFRENGEAVGALLAGWLDAADRLEGDPGARRRVAGLMGMSPAEYEAGRRVIRIPGRAEVRSLCLGPSPGLAGRAPEVAEELRSLDLLPGPVDPGRLLLSPEEAGVLRW
jgi:NitT/TauT family transport system substrate-binding protein